MSAMTRAASAAASRAVGRALSRAKRGAGRVGGMARTAAREDKDLIAVGIGSAALGYARGSGLLDRLPSMGVQPETQTAIAAYVVHKFVKKPWSRAVAAAGIAIGGYKVGLDFAAGRGGGASTSGVGARDSITW